MRRISLLHFTFVNHYFAFCTPQYLKYFIENSVTIHYPFSTIN